MELQRSWRRQTCCHSPPCRHEGPETVQCVGCLARLLWRNIPHVESTNLFLNPKNIRFRWVYCVNTGQLTFTVVNKELLLIQINVLHKKTMTTYSWSEMVWYDSNISFDDISRKSCKHFNTSESASSDCWRLGGVVVRASVLWLRDREFDSRPVHCRIA